MVQNEVMEPQNIPLPHSAAIVVVGESANHPKTTVAGVVDGNGGVRYTIEHGGFHCGIVNHILKNYVVAHMAVPRQGRGELRGWRVYRASRDSLACGMQRRH